jgi:tetratricopeptide (TPR) repeat protein
MVLDSILWALLILGVLGLLGLVIKKIPVLRVIDPKKIIELNQQAVKHSLLELRLKRKLTNLKNYLSGKLTPVNNFFSSQVNKIRLAFSNTEERVQNKINHHSSPQTTKDELMSEAEEALKYNRLPEAEQKYLEVIKLEPHNLFAYEGLAKTYLEEREYEQAQEVFEYLAQQGLIEIAHLGLARVAAGQGRLDDARVEYLAALNIKDSLVAHLELANILIELGLQSEALLHLRDAKRFEPRNPKILDFYIELSIVNGQPIEAQAALDVLREVNPENQKIPEFDKEIRKIADKLKTKRSHSSNKITSFGIQTNRKR